MSFTDASKNASTADQSGYQLVQVDDDGNLVEIDNDGSIWAFSKGDTVEIKLTPDTGYAVESFSIKDTSTGNVLASKETSDNIFSFTMVGKNISIESTFVSLVGDDQAIVYELAELTDEDAIALQDRIDNLPDLVTVAGYIEDILAYEEEYANLQNEIDDIDTIYFDELTKEQRTQIDTSKFFAIKMMFVSYDADITNDRNIKISDDELLDIQAQIDALPNLEEITNVITEENPDEDNLVINSYSDESDMYINKENQDELYQEVYELALTIYSLDIDIYKELDTEKFDNLSNYFSVGAISDDVDIDESDETIEVSKASSIISSLFYDTLADDSGAYTSGYWTTDSYDKSIHSHYFSCAVKDAEGNYQNTMIYCGQAILASEVSTGGTKYFSSAELLTDETMRRILYYGYGGPGDLGIYSYFETHFALSKTYSGQLQSQASQFNYQGLLDYVAEHPIPDEDAETFKVYKLSYGSKRQDMFYYVTEGPVPEPRDPLAITLQKAPNGDGTISSDATLNGAEFTVYYYTEDKGVATVADAKAQGGCTAKFVFQTGNDNNNNPGYIDMGPDDPLADSWTNKYLTSSQDDYDKYFGLAGSYWIVETSAPTGYDLAGTMQATTGAGKTNDINNTGILAVIKAGSGGMEIYVDGQLVNTQRIIVDQKASSFTSEDVNLVTYENPWTPTLRSQARVEDSGTQYANPNTASAKLIDHVNVDHLRDEMDYKVTTWIEDLANPGVQISAMWNGATSQSTSYTTTFTTKGGVVKDDYEFEVSAIVDATAYQNHTLVFMNKLEQGSGAGGAFEEMDRSSNSDTSEQIYFSDLGTKITDSQTLKRITFAGLTSSGSYQSLDDTIYYYNLEPNRNYYVVGYLIDADTGLRATDGKGNEIVIDTSSMQQISSSTGSGSWTVHYSFDATNCQGHKYVAYTEIYLNSMLVGEHKVQTDEQESFYIPKDALETRDTMTIVDY
jgi:hypothetical protein